jgi:plasmid maintenance system antidote protein VapI
MQPFKKPQPDVKASSEYMSPGEFTLHLIRLHMANNDEAAKALGVNERTVRRWLAGERKIPLPIVKLLPRLSPK